MQSRVSVLVLLRLRNRYFVFSLSSNASWGKIYGKKTALRSDFNKIQTKCQRLVLGWGYKIPFNLPPAQNRTDGRKNVSYRSAGVWANLILLSSPTDLSITLEPAGSSSVCQTCPCPISPQLRASDAILSPTTQSHQMLF